MSKDYNFSSCLILMNKHATMFGTSAKASVNSSKSKGEVVAEEEEEGVKEVEEGEIPEIL